MSALVIELSLGKLPPLVGGKIDDGAPVWITATALDGPADPSAGPAPGRRNEQQSAREIGYKSWKYK